MKLSRIYHLVGRFARDDAIPGWIVCGLGRCGGGRRGHVDADAEYTQLPRCH
ncbi:hypothetical protein D3C86_1062010 [compost metagenome]